MSTSNDERRRAMFDAIRTGVNDGTAMAKRREVVEARLAKPSRHPLPERVKKSPADLRTLLCQHLTGQSATIVDVASAADIPEAVANFLRSANLPLRVRMGDDPRLADLPWTKTAALSLDRGKAAPNDEVGLSHASAGVAETGTLVMASGAANPVTLNYMPETHVVVLDAKDIVGPYEDAIDRVRQTFGKGTMPRTVNLISGPSRTGDIGGRLVMGAHGPRRMCVIIVGATPKG